jgi:hypothetical protein
MWPPRTRVDDDLRALAVLLGGLVTVEAWATLSGIYAHLDDAITIGAAVVAIAAVARRRPALLGLAIGVAIAAKPWGIVIVPLAFALERRAALKAIAIGAAVTVLAWGPFVLADSRTLDASTPQAQVVPASVLHLFGVPLGDAPDWTRLLQVGVALVVGYVAVARGRWACVPLVGIAVRLALDPQVYLYYATGLVVAAFAWDLLRARRALPLWTLFVFVLLSDAYVYVHQADVRAVLRLVLTVALVGAVLFAPSGRSSALSGDREHAPPEDAFTESSSVSETFVPPGLNPGFGRTDAEV